MPSGQHESPIKLVKTDPDVLAWLLDNVFQVDLPKYDHATPYANDVQKLVSRTVHIDTVVRFCDTADRSLLAAIMEVQRGWDEEKLWTWKLYLAHVEDELRVRARLVIYFPTAALARRYQREFEADESSLYLRALVFTPEDVPLLVDIDAACANPGLAVLSALCHAEESEVEQVFPALAEALRAVEGRLAVSYYDAVLAGLPENVRTRWRDYMSTTASYEFISEELRTLVADGMAEGMAEGMAKGMAKGEAKGEAEAVLKVLAKRGIAVPEQAREQVLACTDTDQLDEWLGRALTATSIDEVVGR